VRHEIGEAISPDITSAANRVNNPTSSRLPTVSMIAARMIKLVRGGPADGKPKNFESPCCKKSSATTMRRMLRT
jgi:hypothetical protein